MKHIVLTAAAAAAMFSASAANAALFTFSSYSAADPTDTIQYVDNAVGVGGVLSTINNPMVKVKFFQDPNQAPLPAILLNENLAMLTVNAVATEQSWKLGGLTSQLFSSGSISLTFANSLGVGNGNGTNVLSFTFTNMSLNGAGGSASTFASTPDSVFSAIQSDFLDFSNVVDKNFSLNMSSVSPSLSMSNTYTQGPITFGDLNNFTADSGGSFSSDPAPTYVPEPAMLGLFGMGAITLGFARRRKK